MILRRYKSIESVDVRKQVKHTVNQLFCDHKGLKNHFHRSAPFENIWSLDRNIEFTSKLDELLYLRISTVYNFLQLFVNFWLIFLPFDCKFSLLLVKYFGLLTHWQSEGFVFSQILDCKKITSFLLR